MKVFQIDSFIEIMKSENEDLVKSFLLINDVGYNHRLGRGTNRYELNTLYCLFESFYSELTIEQKQGYILGYCITSGIREEFDILRFSNQSVLNIELKSDLPKRGYTSVRNQLVRHKYLLSLLNKNIYVVSFIEKTKELYTLDENNCLKKITIDELITYIANDFIQEDILKEINTSKMIISPYTEPERFSKREYFLTEEQIEKLNDMMSTTKNKICLIGGPGTGKTLLLMDIAKRFIDSGKKVLIVFCSKMSDSEAYMISNKLGIEIVPIRSVNNELIQKNDVILLDEAQRIYNVEFLRTLLSLDDKKVIFSVDHQQTLHPNEKRLNIESKLRELDSVKKIELKNKIRTDEAMSSFIQKFIKINKKGIQPYHYDKVSVAYFETEACALRYIEHMYYEHCYTVIEQTEYRTKTTYSLNRESLFANSLNTHEVLGREYNNVLVVIDKYIYYDDEGYLQSSYARYYPYLENRQFFQALTRVKENLLLVVIDNPDIYVILQKILNWKENSTVNES